LVVFVVFLVSFWRGFLHIFVFIVSAGRLLVSTLGFSFSFSGGGLLPLSLFLFFFLSAGLEKHVVELGQLAVEDLSCNEGVPKRELVNNPPPLIFGKIKPP